MVRSHLPSLACVLRAPVVTFAILGAVACATMTTVHPMGAYGWTLSAAETMIATSSVGYLVRR